MTMTVTDLFSGCGCMSLGFEAAGFKIIYALDNWDVACKSFKMNFPKAKVVCEDALNLAPGDIPDADVIIGGPPCQEFSTANLAKTFDTSLIDWFIEVVNAKKPKYWLLENVPAVIKVLPSNIMKKIYKMCDYGVPQIRRRVFAGYYKEPMMVPIPPHFPAVLATEYKSGSFSNARLYSYFNRRALIPECKIVQTIPIDYLLAGSKTDRYIQIGNAVPPLMAYRFADAILNPHIQTLQMSVLTNKEG